MENAKSQGKYPLGLIEEIKEYCVKIAPHIAYYKKQIEYYNQIAPDTLTNEIALILPMFAKTERQKRGILTSLITGFIGLAYEGISSSLHYKRQNALHKAINAMEIKVDIQCNKIFHLEDCLYLSYHLQN